MKIIPLTQNKYTKVDDTDFEWLSKWSWCVYWNKYTKSFYALRNGKNKNGKKYPVYMAREILGLTKGDKRQADHINHNTLDNRSSNLRIVTIQQNAWNRKNAKGYSWHKPTKKYIAKIKSNGKTIYLGLFHTIGKAHNAYLQAKEKYHKFQSEL